MEQLRRLGLVLLLSSLAPPIAGFSLGAARTSCQGMTPGHVRAQPQDPQRSYVTLRSSASSYLPGQLITVTVRSSRDFMGFLLQARGAGGPEGPGARWTGAVPGGSWASAPPATHTLRCLSEADAVTHSDKRPKRNLSFVWRAPDAPMGPLRFSVTVVQSYFVYWAGVESTVVHDASVRSWSRNNTRTGLEKPTIHPQLKHTEPTKEPTAATTGSAGAKPTRRYGTLETFRDPRDHRELRHPPSSEHTAFHVPQTITHNATAETSPPLAPSPPRQGTTSTQRTPPSVTPASVNLLPSKFEEAMSSAAPPGGSSGSSPLSPSSIHPFSTFTRSSSMENQPSTAPSLSALPSPSPLSSPLRLSSNSSSSPSPPPSFSSFPSAQPASSASSPSSSPPPHTTSHSSSSSSPPSLFGPSPAPLRSLSHLLLPPPSPVSSGPGFISTPGAESHLNQHPKRTVVHLNPEPRPKLKPPPEPSGPPEEEGGQPPNLVPRHRAWELGLLLGCWAGLGLVLLLALRLVYRQACGRRTEVRLDDRERRYRRGEPGSVQVQECGDLVRVRRIRENSLVLLAEYDIVASD